MLQSKTRHKLRFLYGANSPDVARRLQNLLQGYSDLRPDRPADAFLNERDVLLITYADNLRQPPASPLKTLCRFYKHRLADLISVVHLLPFFPYSSDDGFSVIDYRTVDPAHGDWIDIDNLRRDVDLCFDLVCNHVSAASPYFRGFLAGQPAYVDYFITADPETDTSSVLRPRTSPLLHPFQTHQGQKYCWTTFSADQIDLNFKNPDVLLDILDVLLTYVRCGARIVRLDAIAYVWKQPGTSCAHLPQAHTLVRIMRDVLDALAPHVLLLTETNVPHEENISYFGNGRNEAQLVYNFALAPLILHSLTNHDASDLSRWASTLKTPSPRTTFLNFTASHDGIGVRPVADLIGQSALTRLVDRARQHGALVSCKADPQGDPIPYELNINYFDALNNPNQPAALELQLRRFLLSQSIPLVLAGMPAIYIHSLLGSRGYPQGAAQTGRARTINREKLDLTKVNRELDRPDTLRARVFNAYAHMIRSRRRHPAFHPNAPQHILDMGKALVAIKRTARHGQQEVIALHNVTNLKQSALLQAPAPTPDEPDHTTPWTDLLTQRRYHPQSPGRYVVPLAPYETLWLAKTRTTLNPCSR